MPDYDQWNRALLEYFTQGIPLGGKVYLSTDDDVLTLIGQSSFRSSVENDWSHDFCRAVKERVVIEKSVDLQPLKEPYPNGTPQCVAFLGATVLAASYMAEEEDISEMNYFERLQTLLDLEGEGRPSGMKPGRDAEEPLWNIWNHWLLEQGFEPTAQQGGGRNKYINYPISQSLLRQADKDRLQTLFVEKGWRASWDAQTLFAQVRREEKQLSQHLQQIVVEDKQRREAVAEAIHEVYQQWQAQGYPSTPKFGGGKRVWSRTLYAGLYRTEDFLGQSEYFIYPKQQRGRQLESVQVDYRGNTEILNEERPGWYLPIGNPLAPNDLDKEHQCSVISHSELDKLVLPRRDFWILVPDPENLDSGVYGSWGIPALGTPFILVCKKELLEDLQRLRDERLLEWNEEPLPLDEEGNWVEIYDCLVTSRAWDGVFINQELKDALQPTIQLSISLSGGLRVPIPRGWVEGYLPQVTVFGFSRNVDLEVVRLSDEKVVLPSRSQPTNTPMPLDSLPEGLYLIKANSAREAAERIIRVVGWKELEMLEPMRQESIVVSKNASICGSLIQNNA